MWWSRSPSRNAGESGAGRDDRIAVHAAELPRCALIPFEYNYGECIGSLFLFFFLGGGGWLKKNGYQEGVFCKGVRSMEWLLFG